MILPYNDRENNCAKKSLAGGQDFPPNSPFRSSIISPFLLPVPGSPRGQCRAKGLKERVVVWRHAFRNAMISVVTVVGLQFGFLLGGSVVTEQVFAFPGLGNLLIESVNYRDYPAIQSLILIFSLHFVVINLIVDVLYAVLNPEIQLS